MKLLNILIVVLQAYFLLMNATVERYYCHSELVATDNRFLVAETVAFSEQHNPLFLSRPEWLRIATCMSAYGLCWGYLLVAFSALTNSWRAMSIPLLIILFVGIKTNAVGFYHVMEFMSDMPPQNPIPYFGVEGPYIVSICF